MVADHMTQRASQCCLWWFCRYLMLDIMTQAKWLSWKHICARCVIRKYSTYFYHNSHTHFRYFYSLFARQKLCSQWRAKFPSSEQTIWSDAFNDYVFFLSNIKMVYHENMDWNTCIAFIEIFERLLWYARGHLFNLQLAMYHDNRKIKFPWKTQFTYLRSCDFHTDFTSNPYSNQS